MRLRNPNRFLCSAWKRIQCECAEIFHLNTRKSIATPRRRISNLIGCKIYRRIAQIGQLVRILVGFDYWDWKWNR